ncbi:hypothetical protein AeRB84_004867 [Aphanomyces euteiches]|nr:hypothetical protein AeRB84_004867 [Aphanomyces euteiches]
MQDDECSCGCLPCLCVTEEEVIQANKLAKLRAMLQTTTAPCDFCLMLPCICDGEPLPVANTEPEEEDQDESNEKKLPKDAYGRVELGPDDNESTGIWIAEELEKVLKPHQREGVQFLLQHVANNQGCILADYMGLGKTIQLITTIHSFLIDGIPHRSQRTALVLCPTVCILNWVQEFQKWLTPASLEKCPIYQMDTGSSYKCNTASRVTTLQEWKTTGGVLIMGYEMFRLLLNPSRVVNEPVLDVVTHMTTGMMEISDKKQNLVDRQLRQILPLLCSPGPDLVALDEGHRIKDPTSLLSTSLDQIKTTKRVVLTGYPLQNSLSEYWCMVNFCRPGFLGIYEEFRQNYEKPILEGNVEVSAKLTKLLSPVVLRRGRQLLNSHLPTKTEWIIHCQLSQLQHKLYLDFLSTTDRKQWDLFTAYTTLLQIVNHPDVLHRRLEALGDSSFSDNSDDIEQTKVDEWQPLLSSKPKPKKRKRPEVDQRLAANLEWAESSFPPEYVPNALDNSGKMVFLLELIRESRLKGDKLVVFSQSVTTLQCIAYFISQMNKSSPASSETSKGRRKTSKPRSSQQDTKPHNEYSGCLVIDGSLSSSKRMDHIKTFSESKSGIDVLLVSTKAGAEGINLHAANRLVLFDVSWNPSHDHQSMCRSHRIGQTKDVHVYRFVSHDTMEEKIYDQQVKKVGLSSNVVDAAVMQSSSGPTSSFFALPEAPSLDTMRNHALSGDTVLDKCLAAVGKWVPKYFQAVSESIDE